MVHYYNNNISLHLCLLLYKQTLPLTCFFLSPINIFVNNWLSSFISGFLPKKFCPRWLLSSLVLHIHFATVYRMLMVTAINPPLLRLCLEPPILEYITLPRILEKSQTQSEHLWQFHSHFTNHILIMHSMIFHFPIGQLPDPFPSKSQLYIQN